MKNYKRSFEEQRLLQERRLRAILKFAYQNVPFYHERFRSVGIYPEDIRSTKDLVRLPKLTRREVTENQGKLSSGFRVAVRRSTSGTTGTPVRIDWSPNYADIVIALKMRRLKVAGAKFADRAAWVSYFGSSSSQTNSPLIKLSVGSNLKRIMFGSIDVRNPVLRSSVIGISEDNFEQVALKLSQGKYKVVLSRPSYLRRIGLIAKRIGLSLDIPIVLCEGEILSRGCASDLRELYRGDVFETYAASEFGTMGSQCRIHEGIHIDTDQFVLETLRDGEQVAFGENGKVAITCLGNYSMPLIRYEIGDVAIPEKDSVCECGSSLMRLRSVEGRLNDGLIANDGKRIAPGRVVEHLEDQLGLRDFQVVQSGVNQIIVKMRESDIQRPILEGVSGYLESLVYNAKIEFVSWGECEMPPKYRPIMQSLPSINTNFAISKI